MDVRQLQALEDLKTLVGTVREEVGIHLQQAGYCIYKNDEQGDELGLAYEHDQDEADRWMTIMAAEERVSEVLLSAGHSVTTEYDYLFRAVQAYLVRNHGPGAKA